MLQSGYHCEREYQIHYTNIYCWSLNINITPYCTLYQRYSYIWAVNHTFDSLPFFTLKLQGCKSTPTAQHTSCGAIFLTKAALTNICNTNNPLHSIALSLSLCGFGLIASNIISLSAHSGCMHAIHSSNQKLVNSFTV